MRVGRKLSRCKLHSLQRIFNQVFEKILVSVSTVFFSIAFELFKMGNYVLKGALIPKRVTYYFC